MTDADQPQIYLIAPSDLELSQFPDTLARVLDTHPIACLRLALATRDESRIARTADACREVAHARDVAIVLDTHFALVPQLGLDGVHLNDGARSVRKARKALGQDAIVGSYCAQSRHEGISAGEAGADYVSFGPMGASPLDDGAQADPEIFAWWSEMIELPVVAVGALNATLISALSPVTDFFAIGDEIWSDDDPALALTTLLSAMKQG
ncbi:thiamine phosphate synthase [Roseovarius aestuarii]|nr:thiamine phosphate synthase [Roseovarius aestuarii]